MITLFTALRSAIYGTLFVLLWGWLAIAVRSNVGELFVLPSPAPTVGILFMIVGGMVALWCVSEFVTAGRGTPAPFDAPRALVRSGPYRYVRNPMYVGGFAVLIGYGFWISSATVVLFSLAFLLIAHAFVLFYEEPALSAQFGANYKEYKEQVGRWIPKFRT